MRLGSGGHTYEWIDGWARYPDTESLRTGWSHHGVVVTESGQVVTYHPGDPAVMVFDKGGKFERSWTVDYADAHGMTLAKEGNTEYLWVADNGSKRHARDAYEYPQGSGGRVEGKVVKTTLDGRTVLKLEQPDLEIYRDGDYKPTWVAVNEERNGGNGDVWVADGYGQNCVHRFTRSVEYIGTINGEEGQAGAFNCPHAIFVDTRKSEPELYVADRGNGRVQVFDLEGKFKRVFGSDIFTTPSGIVTHGDHMIVAELRARIAILDIDDNLVTYLGDNLAVCDVDGWPNILNQNGVPSRTNLLEPGKFNSPHGIAVDADGNIYVAEWLIGGRFIKLARN